jgi:hypothetical protein
MATEKNHLLSKNYPILSSSVRAFTLSRFPGFGIIWLFIFIAVFSLGIGFPVVLLTRPDDLQCYPQPCNLTIINGQCRGILLNDPSVNCPARNCDDSFSYGCYLTNDRDCSLSLIRNDCLTSNLGNKIWDIYWLVCGVIIIFVLFIIFALIWIFSP